MQKYIIRRILFFVPMFFIVSFLAFILVNASTKSPASVVLEAQGVPRITKELVEETNEKYGFNRPILSRYKDWLSDAIRFEFGKSFVSNQDVSTSIKSAFLYTLKLATSTTMFTIMLSFALGVLCVVFEGRLFDRVTRSIMFFISAVPPYLIGTVLVWLFSVKFMWFPTSGVGTLKNYVLPTFVMSIGYCGLYFRMIRNAILENINQNYVSFYRSSGVSEKKIMKHIIRNSMQTVITAFSMAIPAMIAGTVVIENIFAWPGLGRLCVSAIFSRDIPIIQAYVLLIAIFYLIFNILSDIINAIINPVLRRG